MDVIVKTLCNVGGWYIQIILPYFVEGNAVSKNTPEGV